MFSHSFLWKHTGGGVGWSGQTIKRDHGVLHTSLDYALTYPSKKEREYMREYREKRVERVLQVEGGESETASGTTGKLGK